ncbi:MAG: tRNA (N(6)-L-threonylcarbamoyladenosine(37)-C(2))-methylthiotransferase MtaB [Bacteroidales bacterium]
MELSLNVKKVAFHTLGCKLNFSESSTIARDFIEKGYQRVRFSEPADVYVINTCTVTDQADRKCRQTVKKIVKQNPGAIVAVIGCYAQLKSDEIMKIPGVGIVLGANEKFSLFKYIEQHQLDNQKVEHSCEIDAVVNFDPAYSSGDRTRSFLKVQDGCNYPCTYCTIPKARGHSRSASIEKTLEQAREIASKGFKEIILTGVNIGDFGRSTGESFFGLLKELDKIEGIDRYRISSIEPNLLTDEIIEFVAKSNKFLPHFHIPLQSGSNEILAKMKRRYRRELFADRIMKIKGLMPFAFIGVDVIVGFPGETDEKFRETYDFLRSLDISFLHVFSYSVRPGTMAAEMNGKVDSLVIQQRSKILHQLSEEKHSGFYTRNIGHTDIVLFEARKENGRISGFTRNYIRVSAPFSQNIINKPVVVKLDKQLTSTCFEVVV